MKTALDAEMQALLTESQRFAAPLDSDRQRITEALRARLGAGVVDAGNAGIDPVTSEAGGHRSGGTQTAAAARTMLSGGGWLKLVIATGIVSGALGFALGYQLKGSELAPPQAQVPAPSGASVPELPPVQRGTAPAAPAPAVDTTLATGGALATHGAASGTSDSPDGHAASTDAAPASPRESAIPDVRAAAVEHQPRAALVPSRAGRARPARPSVVPASDGAEAAWSFAEVIERLRRANLALGRGQASLALMLLAEIDRHAGATLREERDVTRVLTLCALGEDAAAQQVAEPLLAGDSGSIYTRRLEQSCAAPARP